MVMKIEREQVVTSGIHIDSLEDNLNAITQCPHLQYRNMTVRRSPKVVETLVAPDGTYTIIWSKNNDDSLREAIDVYIKAWNTHAEWQNNRQALDAERERNSEANRLAYNQQRLDDWNNGSFWRRWFTPAPIEIPNWKWELDHRTGDIWYNMGYMGHGFYEMEQVGRLGIIVKNEVGPATIEYEVPKPRRELSDPTRY